MTIFVAKECTPSNLQMFENKTAPSDLRHDEMDLRPPTAPSISACTARQRAATLASPKPYAMPARWMSSTKNDWRPSGRSDFEKFCNRLQPGCPAGSSSVRRSTSSPSSRRPSFCTSDDSRPRRSSSSATRVCHTNLFPYKEIQ